MPGPIEQRGGGRDQQWNRNPLGEAFARSGGTPNSKLDRERGRPFIPRLSPLVSIAEIPWPDARIPPESGIHPDYQAKYHGIGLNDVQHWLANLPTSTRETILASVGGVKKFLREEREVDLPFLRDLARQATTRAKETAGTVLKALGDERGGVIYPGQLALGVREDVDAVARKVVAGLTHTKKHPKETVQTVWSVGKRVAVPVAVGVSTAFCAPAPASPTAEVVTKPITQEASTPSQSVILQPSKEPTYVYPTPTKAFLDQVASLKPVNRNRVNSYIFNHPQVFTAKPEPSPDPKLLPKSPYTYFELALTPDNNRVSNMVYLIADGKGDYDYQIIPDGRVLLTIPEGANLFFWSQDKPNNHVKVETPAVDKGRIINIIYDTYASQIIYELEQNDGEIQVARVQLQGGNAGKLSYDAPLPTRTPTAAVTSTPTEVPAVTATATVEATKTPTATPTPTEVPAKFTWVSPMTVNFSKEPWQGWADGFRQGGTLEVLTENGVTFFRSTVTDNTVHDRKDGRNTIRIYNAVGNDQIPQLSNQSIKEGGCRIEVPFRYFYPQIFGKKLFPSVVSAFSHVKSNNLIGAVNIDEKGRPQLIVFPPDSGSWYGYVSDDESLKPGEFTTLGFQVDEKGVHLVRNGVIKKTLQPHPNNLDKRPDVVHAGAYIVAEDPQNYPQVPNGTIIDNGPLSVKCW